MSGVRNIHATDVGKSGPQGGGAGDRIGVIEQADNQHYRTRNLGESLAGLSAEQRRRPVSPGALSWSTAVDLRLHVLHEGRIADLVLGHPMDVLRMLDYLGDDLILAFSRHDRVTIWPNIPAMKVKFVCHFAFLS